MRISDNVSDGLTSLEWVTFYSDDDVDVWQANPCKILDFLEPTYGDHKPASNSKLTGRKICR